MLIIYEMSVMGIQEYMHNFIKFKKACNFKIFWVANFQP